jgi:mannose-6-phosphate isomerase-like protein (cupin superfamily)
MTFRAVSPEELDWVARPHADGEPARHVAELNDLLGLTHVPASVWRYEPGASGRRHRHADQEETFVVLSGMLTMYLGEPPKRVDLPAGSVINVAATTPLQTVNHGSEDLLVYAYGYPADDGAEVLDPVDLSDGPGS